MKSYEAEIKSNPGNWVISENRNTTIKVGEISDKPAWTRVIRFTFRQTDREREREKIQTD
jgi:hypothetical protein